MLQAKWLKTQKFSSVVTWKYCTTDFLFKVKWKQIMERLHWLALACGEYFFMGFYGFLYCTNSQAFYVIPLFAAQILQPEISLVMQWYFNMNFACEISVVDINYNWF